MNRNWNQPGGRAIFGAAFHYKEGEMSRAYDNVFGGRAGVWYNTTGIDWLAPITFPSNDSPWLCGFFMPIHDWSRVRAGKFHHFHNSWIYKLSDRLNGGLLPDGFYAAGEQVAGAVEPDVLTLQSREPPQELDWRQTEGVVALADQPPQVGITKEAEESVYVRKQDTVCIRAVDNDRLVALIEVVSRGNKDSRHEMDRFLRKIASALDLGVHAIVVDLHQRGSFNPGGIHNAIWEFLFGAELDTVQDRPLTVVAFRASPIVVAYCQPLSVGDALPDMPLFLDADWYIHTPLEETYMLAYSGLPAPWRQELST